MTKEQPLIVRKFSRDVPMINVYPIGDPQVGSPNFDADLWSAWEELMMSDPYGYGVIVGDMVNNALKGSKSDSYDEDMRPAKAREWLENRIGKIAPRLLGGVPGNHEARSWLVGDFCPLYEIFKANGIKELYRRDLAFVKINLGEKSKDRQFSYTLALAHGAGKGKTSNFAYTMDGIDVFVTGHIHQPMSAFPAKLVVDPHNEVVRTVPFAHVIVPSFDRFGGYTARGLYQPQSSEMTPIIKLYGTEKRFGISWEQLKCT